MPFRVECEHDGVGVGDGRTLCRALITGWPGSALRIWIPFWYTATLIGVHSSQGLDDDAAEALNAAISVWVTEQRALAVSVPEDTVTSVPQ